MNCIRKVAATAALVCLLGGGVGVGMVRAHADPVRFEFRGGSWSHRHHRGWHRYWGGPSVGYYWAPQPVYVVQGYDDPHYYTGPNYWYSNPSFGLTLGGSRSGWYDNDHHFHRYRRGDRDDRWRDRGDRDRRDRDDRGDRDRRR